MAGVALRQLTEAELSAWFQPALLTAAEDYLVAERLRRPAAAGHRLAARLEGFRGDYEVSAFLVDGDLTLACTCGQRQPCRHAAALVLAWVRRRDWFTDLDELVQPLAAVPTAVLADLVGRVAVEPEDRLEPILAAVTAASASQPTLPVAPGRWLEPQDVAAVVSALAASWEQAVAGLARPVEAEGESADGTNGAWQAVARLLEEGIGLLGRARDEAGLLVRFLGACLAQVPGLLEPEGADMAKQSAIKLLTRVLGSGPVELARPAGAALAVLGAQAPGLAALARAKLLAQAWEQEAARSVAGAAAPQLMLRQGLLLEALADLLVATGGEAAVPSLLQPFPHVWQAAARRVAVLRRLSRPAEALQAAREGLATAEGQASLDLQRASGELLLELGRPKEALPHLLADYLGRPSPATLRQIREIAEAAGNWGEVERQLRQRP